MTAISGSIDIYGLNQIIHVTVKTGGFFFHLTYFLTVSFPKSVSCQLFKRNYLMCVACISFKRIKIWFCWWWIVISEIVFKKTTQSQSCVGETADCVESLECSCLSSFVWRICVMSKCMLWNRRCGCVSWTGCPVAQLASNRIRTHFSEDSFCHSNTNNTRQETK